MPPRHLEGRLGPSGLIEQVISAVHLNAAKTCAFLAFLGANQGTECTAPMPYDDLWHTQAQCIDRVDISWKVIFFKVVNLFERKPH